MPEKDSRCHADDQPFVTLHEITHLRQIKGTDDYGVYGYQAVRRLSAAQNLNHADTYALFANGEGSPEICFIEEILTYVFIAIEVGGSC
jgi:deuterolysin